MAKVYVITDTEIEALLLAIDRDLKYGTRGGSSVTLSKEEIEASEIAHRFYNYQIRTWIDKIKA